MRCLFREAAPRRCKGWAGLPDGAACAVAFAYHAPGWVLQAVSLEALDASGERLSPRWRRTVGKRKGSVFCAQELPCDAAGIVVTEGEVSAMAARWMHPACAVYATGGTTGLAAWRPSPTQARVLVIIEADGDLWGRKTARRLQIALDEQGVAVRVVWRGLESGCDPADDLAATLMEREALLEYEGGYERPAATVAAWQSVIGNGGDGYGE